MKNTDNIMRKMDAKKHTNNKNMEKINYKHQK